MEYIVGIAVVAAIAYLLFSNKKTVDAAVVETQPEAAPYKVEAPVEPVKKPTVKKASTRPAKIQGEKKPAVKAKTARKPKAPKV